MGHQSEPDKGTRPVTVRTTPPSRRADAEVGLRPSDEFRMVRESDLPTNHNTST